VFRLKAVVRSGNTGVTADWNHNKRAMFSCVVYI